MCWGEGKVGRTQGPGGGEEGLLEGRQVVESEGTPFPCGRDNPHPIRLRADPLWLCLFPPSPESTLPSSSIPLCDFLHHPPPPLLPASHTVLCQLPPPVRCKCLAGIRPPGDLQPWERRAGRSSSRVPGPGGENDSQGSEVKRPVGPGVLWTGWSVQSSHHLSRKNLRARSMFMRWPTLVTPRST